MVDDGLDEPREKLRRLFELARGIEDLPAGFGGWGAVQLGGRYPFRRAIRSGFDFSA